MNLSKMTLLAFATVVMNMPVASNAVNVEKHFDKELSVTVYPVKSLTGAKSQRSQPAVSDKITDPAGTVTVYSRSSLAIEPVNDVPMETVDYGFAGVMVTGDNGDVYLKNPFCLFPTDTYLKGTITDDKISIELPQNFASVNDEDEVVELYAYLLDFSEDGTKMIPTENQTLTFVKEGESWVMTGDAILGLTLENAEWQGFGELDMRYDPVNAEAAKMPDGATPSADWILVYDGQGHSVEMAVEGDKCYLNNFFKTETGSVAPLVGTKTGNTLTFPSGQYLGIDEDNSYLTYFYACDVEYVYDEMSNSDIPVFTTHDNLIFTLNDDGSYSCSSCALFTPFTDLDSEYLWYMDLYQNPLLKENKVGDYTPAAPSVKAFQYYESMGFGYVTFDIPMLNTDGMLLDLNKLYYNVYINGDKFTLYPDEYHMLKEEITDIPYDFTDAHGGLNGDITIEGSLRTFILFSEGIESVGAQSFYVDGDKVYYSKLVEENVSGGINDVKQDTTIVEETYIDLAGRRVITPEKGVYIKRVKMADGSVKSVKVTF